MKDDLEVCPFCGHKVILGKVDTYMIKCDYCRAWWMYADKIPKYEAIKKWNERKK